MTKTRQTTLLALLFALLCAPCVVNADNEPREFTDEEIAAAEKVRLSLSTEQRALYDGLRTLLRPGYEEELMTGRRIRNDVLDPFEDGGEGALTTLEMLRLWVVLDAGMPVTGAVESTVKRLLEVPVPDSQDNLAPYMIPMAVCTAACRREGLRGLHGDLRSKAEEFYAKSLEKTGATSERSSLIEGDTIEARWFANHLWRGLGFRYALEIGLEVDRGRWKHDLRTLCAAYTKDDGWVVGKTTGRPHPALDLNPNMIAMAALATAVTAPEGTLSNTTMRTVTKKTKLIPALLSRLEEDFRPDAYTGAHLALIRTFAPDWAPERKSAEAWRDDIMRTRLASNGTGLGTSRGMSSLLPDLGITERRWRRGKVQTGDTAVTCLAITGGLIGGAEPPLAQHTLSEIGRTMYAFSVIHASQARRMVDGDDLDSMTALAIENGCAWLENIQEADGGFPGRYGSYPANAALAMLALMHGGWDRDHSVIQQGMTWMIDTIQSLQNRSHGTYNNACVLMFFQKYYEPEQQLHRILWVNDAKEFEVARREVWKDIPARHREIINLMVKEIDDAHLDSTKGGWGYNSAGLVRNGEPHSDNSISQYAMLGIKAASLLGAEINIKHVRHEAERLVRQYWEDPTQEPIQFEFTEEDEKRTSSNSWDGKIRPGGWAYMCGNQSRASMQLTAAGMSSLAVARDELRIREKLDRSLRRKIDLTLRGAEMWVKQTYYTTERLEGDNGEIDRPTRDGWGIYYNLYSVERGCELAGVRQFGGEIDWYLIGASALIQMQNFDGDWGLHHNHDKELAKPQTVNTAMAILFLKRASLPVITEHRKREKERQEREAEKEDKPRSPITRGPGDKKDEKKEAE